MLVKRLECRVHSRAVARLRKVQEGLRQKAAVARFRRKVQKGLSSLSWPGGQGVALGAVSREVTDVFWDSHHTDGVWFGVWLVLSPVI